MGKHARVVFVNGRANYEGGDFDFDHERQSFRFRYLNILGGRDPDTMLIPWMATDGAMRAFVFVPRASIRAGSWFEPWTKSDAPPGWDTAD